MQKILDTVDAQLETSLERLFAFLRIPSISAQPAHAADCRKAAEWARDTLAGMGFAARLSETSGLPGVIATNHEAGPNAPHVLFYGHYDVQPADPLELWNSDPFNPQLVDGPRGKRIVARGAVDDKGQVVSFLEAVRAHLSVNGKLPVRLTVLLEGEEENGSPSLAELLTNERETLAADFVYVADTNMWDFQTPAITTSLRGLAAIEVRLHGPKRDLHSGLFGGIALNPIQALVSILGGLKDEHRAHPDPRLLRRHRPRLPGTDGKLGRARLRRLQRSSAMSASPPRLARPTNSPSPSSGPGRRRN